MRFRSLATVILSIAIMLFGLAGCGQKGPLVLPKAHANTALR